MENSQQPGLHHLPIDPVTGAPMPLDPRAMMLHHHGALDPADSTSMLSGAGSGPCPVGAPGVAGPGAGGAGGGGGGVAAAASFARTSTTIRASAMPMPAMAPSAAAAAAAAMMGVGPGPQPGAPQLVSLVSGQVRGSCRGAVFCAHGSRRACGSHGCHTVCGAACLLPARADVHHAQGAAPLGADAAHRQPDGRRAARHARAALFRHALGHGAGLWTGARQQHRARDDAPRPGACVGSLPRGAEGLSALPFR